MTHTPVVTSGFRTLEDLQKFTSQSSRYPRKVITCCEDCMSENAKASFSFLRARTSDISVLTEQGVCRKCLDNKPVYDVPFLILMHWYGLIEGDNPDKLIENCPNVPLFERAIEFLKRKQAV
jgi:hypothetical protein